MNTNFSLELKKKIFITSLENICNKGIDFSGIASNFPFIYDHVGGHGTNSPKRGVYVCGNKLLDDYIIKKTYWNIYQQASNSTLEVKPVAMPDKFFELIPKLIKKTKEYFPKFQVSDSTYTLFVANKYKKSMKQSIAGHTDDQYWYTRPAIFCSVTFFPKGNPISFNHTHRFQVYDETDHKWKNLFLQHNSVCIMRADVKHRVLPPLQKYVKSGDVKTRINLTFRNICCRKKDPLGFLLGFSNHYRYYGIPRNIFIPEDQNISPKYKKVIEKYKNLNKNLVITELDETCKIRNLEKKQLRLDIIKKYEVYNLDLLYTKLFLSKNNCTLELMKLVLSIIKN